MELLLDTITNVFGGIVFLAMLVVVLVQTTSPPASTDELPDYPDPVELAAELASIQERLTPLRSKWQLTENMANRLADARLKSTLKELQALRSQRDGQELFNLDLAESAAEIAGEVAELESVHSQLDEDLRDAETALAEVQERLLKEQESRKMKLSFPEERPATKEAFNVTVRYGRLYVDLKPDGSANLEDFTVLDSSGEYLVTTPKPFAGVSLAAGGRLSTEAMARFRSLSTTRRHIDISIWDDSYEEFQYLRDYLIQSGFEYRLILVKEGDAVTYGSVANPLVQ